MKTKLSTGLKWIKVTAIIFAVFLGMIFLNGLFGLGTVAFLNGRVGFMHYMPLLVSLIGMVSAIIVALTIIKPTKKKYELSIISLITTTIIAGAYGIFSQVYSYYHMGFANESAVIPVLALLFGSLYIWYLKKTKKYFVYNTINADDPWLKKADKKVITWTIIGIVLFVIVPIINVGLSSGILMAPTFMHLGTFTNIQTFDGKMAVCSADESPNTCYYALAINGKADYGSRITEACAKIDKRTMRNTCYYTTQECDGMTQSEFKYLCYDAQRMVDKMSNFIGVNLTESSTSSDIKSEIEITYE